MNGRALSAATVVAVIVAVAAFRVLLLLPILAVPIAGLAGGVVLGLVLRPDDWSEVATPGIVVATAATVAAMLTLAGAGGSPIEPRFIIGWLVSLVLGVAACSAVARAFGALAPRGLR